MSISRHTVESKMSVMPSTVSSMLRPTATRQKDLQIVSAESFRPSKNIPKISSGMKSTVTFPEPLTAVSAIQVHTPEGYGEPEQISLYRIMEIKTIMRFRMDMWHCSAVQHSRRNIKVNPTKPPVRISLISTGIDNIHIVHRKIKKQIFMQT